MKQFFLAILILGSVLALPESDGLDSFFKEADSFFKVNVKKALVDYRSIGENPSAINSLVEQIAKASLSEATDSEKKAFYINSYNILIIYAIIQNGIPESPLDIEGFFDRQKHTVAGKPLTFDELEKETLFPSFPDARIHFALVCAAKGCPPIRPYAYLPDNLDRLLKKSTVNTLNNDYFIRVKPQEGQVLISEIFKWYRSDFLAEAESLLDYINTYRQKKISPSLDVGYYTYDWSLNKLN